MKRGRVWILTALVLAAVVGVAAERVVMEAILVRVNDRVVTISDFRERLRQELSQHPEPPYGEELRGFAEGLFDAVVEELLLLERARDARITVDDSDVDRAIDGLREENNLEDDRAFEQALTDAGLTVEKLRQRYRESILLHRALQTEVRPTEITEEELRKVYDAELDSFKTPAKVALLQVFFPVVEDDSDRDQVVRTARGLVDRVSRGADLIAEATLAGVEVQDLGAIPEGDLRQELMASLAELGPGELTEPIAIPGGLQVLRLVERIPAGHLPFDEVKEGLRRRQSEESFESQTKGMVERLKQQYLVETHPELVVRALEGIM